MNPVLTVQELIAQLEKLPPDHVVLLDGTPGRFHPVTLVTHNESNRSVTLWLD